MLTITDNETSLIHLDPFAQESKASVGWVACANGSIRPGDTVSNNWPAVVVLWWIKTGRDTWADHS